MKSSNTTWKRSYGTIFSKKSNQNLKLRNLSLLDILIFFVTLYLICRNKTVIMIKNLRNGLNYIIV